MKKETSIVSSGTVVGSLVTKLSPAQALVAFQDVVTAYTSYKQTTEEEATKREEIQAKREIVLEKIRMQRDFLMEALRQSFEERRHLFEKIFSIADDAIAKGDSQNLGIALQGMVEIAKSNPFALLADTQKTRNALQDPNHKWKF